MFFRINTAFYRQLPAQILVELLPKPLRLKHRKNEIYKLHSSIMNTEPSFSEKEILAYKNSIKTVKLWHGTGKYEYPGEQIVDVASGIFKNGLKTHLDSYLVIYSKSLKMNSISLVDSRIIARCYADTHNFGEVKDFRFGDGVFYIVRHYARMYLLAYNCV